MDCPHGRSRGRKGRCCSHYALPHYIHSPQREKTRFFDSLYSFFIMSSLIAVVYLMLEYHCSTCSASKTNIHAITKNLEDIANNLAVMKNNYVELETKISEFSREIPKLEGQIEILEALATTMEKQGKLAWEPRTSMCLPNVDISLANGAGDLYKRNCTFESRFARGLKTL